MTPTRTECTHHEKRIRWSYSLIAVAVLALCAGTLSCKKGEEVPEDYTIVDKVEPIPFPLTGFYTPKSIETEEFQGSNEQRTRWIRFHSVDHPSNEVEEELLTTPSCRVWSILLPSVTPAVTSQTNEREYRDRLIRLGFDAHPGETYAEIPGWRGGKDSFRQGWQVWSADQISQIRLSFIPQGRQDSIDLGQQAFLVYGSWIKYTREGRQQRKDDTGRTIYHTINPVKAGLNWWHGGIVRKLGSVSEDDMRIAFFNLPPFATKDLRELFGFSSFLALKLPDGTDYREGRLILTIGRKGMTPLTTDLNLAPEAK